MSIIESALARMRGANVPRTESAGPAAVVTPLAAEPSRSARVDLSLLRDAGYLPDERLERRFAEYFRRIKRPLIEQAVAEGSGTRVILVSSALPGDGKTFTSINLAISMARERDRSVLLIDADIPRAQISRVFGLGEERGLVGALTDEVHDVDSLVVRTDITGLEILPAGRSVDDATELLASARMSRLLAQLGARNPRRLIVIDSAPLMATSEGRALLPIAEQVLLVVRAGVTPQRAVLDAVALVDKSKLRGLVLNQAPVSGDASYGYSGYLGYPDYGARDDEPARSD